MAGTYTTKSGDQWDSIAHRALGSVDHTGVLISANMAYREYWMFPSGIVLTLPDIEETVGEDLPPWKRVST